MCVLIAIEGIDGSGKGTQASRLHAQLLAQGRKTALLSFPRYDQTAFGRKIGDFLNGKFGGLDQVHPLLVSLLFAGDRFESRNLIEQTIANHDIVICDRYVASNIAHQGAKVVEENRDELIDWIRHLEFSIYKLPEAQMTIFLDVPVEFAQKLIAAKNQRTYTDKAADLQEADGHYLQRVRHVYQQLAKGSEWSTISCTAENEMRPMEEITSEILAAVDSALQRNRQ